MSSIYLYADETSREVLLNEQQKIALIGSDTGHANFGDVLQLVNSINVAKQSKRFATVCVMGAHAIAFKESPATTRQNYGTDAIVFVAEYPLILEDSSPRLELVVEIRNLAAIHLYGGGFLNDMWGDYVLGITEYFLRLAPHASYLVSGQQITSPYQSRVLEHIKAFKPTLFGVRDELSQQWLREAGFNPLFSFDDATEALLDLTEMLPLQRGSGLLMHINASSYTANNVLARGLGDEMQKLKASRWAQDGITLFQAFRDPRYEVHDSRETVKILDVAFPFTDLRVIELGSMVYGGKEVHLARPIVGEIGYSCSYHVALWLQLAGIPCWLRSSNPFYDQKSRALQVTQDLESFLAAPSLADHRVNLERRAQWNALFARELAIIPDAQNLCRIPENANGPAPWPFFFKGTPSIDERLDQSILDGNALRARAEAAEASLADSYGRLEALNAQLTVVGNEAHALRARAEAAESSRNNVQVRLDLLNEQFNIVPNEIHVLRARAEAAETNINHIFQSRSWRLTKPFRAIARFFRHGYFDSQGRVGLFAVSQKIGRKLPLPAGLRNRIGRVLTKFRRQI